MEKHSQFSLKQTNGTGAASDFVSTPNVTRTDKDFVVKGYFVANNTDTILGRGQIIARKATSAVYSAAAIDYLLGVTSLVSAPTIGLPRPKLVGVGKLYVVKDEVGGAGTTTITVVSQGEELIDGASSSTITSNYGAKAFYTDGANWFTY